MHAAVGAQTRDVPAEDTDGAGVGREISGDQVEERGLARAVGAEQEPPLSLEDGKGDVAHGGNAAERFEEPLQFQGGGSHARVPVRTVRRRSRSIPGTSPSGM